MSLLKEDTFYSSVFFPEKKLETDNYYYYEILPLTCCSSMNQGENERLCYESSFSPNNSFDCFSFMDFSNTDDKLPELPIKSNKSLFISDTKEKPKMLFYTYKKEKKVKQPAMICYFKECGMAFRHKWIFEKHLSSHIDGKFFKCPEPECNKLYKSKENLNLHMKNIHEGIKPYQCKYCSIRFSHRNGIYIVIIGKTYHERKFHNHFLPHVCNLFNCTKAFASRSALNYHKMNQH